LACYEVRGSAFHFLVCREGQSLLRGRQHERGLALMKASRGRSPCASCDALVAVDANLFRDATSQIPTQKEMHQQIR
jgi:hypothetical protein